MTHWPPFAYPNRLVMSVILLTFFSTVSRDEHNYHFCRILWKELKHGPRTMIENFNMKFYMNLLIYCLLWSLIFHDIFASVHAYEKSYEHVWVHMVDAFANLRNTFSSSLVLLQCAFFNNLIDATCNVKLMKKFEYYGYIIYSIVSVITYPLLTVLCYIYLGDTAEEHPRFRYQMIPETFYCLELLVSALIIFRINSRMKREIKKRASFLSSNSDNIEMLNIISKRMIQLGISTLGLSVCFSLISIEAAYSEHFPELVQAFMITFYMWFQVIFIYFIFQMMYAFKKYYRKKQETDQLVRGDSAHSSNL